MRILPILALIFALATPVAADTVNVFAAASLKDALDRIGADWQAATGNTVTVAYAGSAALAKQIAEGAPADIFIPASPEWMDVLETEGLIQPGSRTDLLGNTLVLVAHGEDAPPVSLSPALDLPALLGDGRLAMGMVTSVPAGIYGREALTSLGLWDATEPLTAQSENVRAALALVALGETPFGIVYGSDAVAARAAGEPVSVVATFPTESHSPIIFPAALISRNPAAAQFLTHLRSDQADAVFTGLGFSLIP